MIEKAPHKISMVRYEVISGKTYLTIKDGSIERIKSYESKEIAIQHLKKIVESLETKKEVNLK